MHITQTQQITSKNKMALIAAAVTVAGIIGMLQVSQTAFGVSYGNGYGAPTSSTPVFRLYSKSGDHFYTTSASEKASALGGNYADEGTGFRAYTTSPAGGIPIYRAYSKISGDHFFTANFTEYLNSTVFGYTPEGAGFFGWDTVGNATSGLAVDQVLRLYNDNKSKDHFYTINPAEKTSALAGAYVDEGNAFVTPTN